MRRSRLPLYASGLAMALILVIGMCGCTGAAGSKSSGELDSLAATAYAINQNDQLHNILESYASMQPEMKVYVSLGRSADYPDQYLLTVSTPTANTAAQYLIDPAAGPDAIPGGTDIDPSTMGSDVKQWNATLNENGFLLVKGREAASVGEENVGE